ncbi:MAG: hypothetical protein ACJ76H_17280 [Bacteriovoracaceae bacterium]
MKLVFLTLTALLFTVISKLGHANHLHQGPRPGPSPMAHYKVVK